MKGENELARLVLWVRLLEGRYHGEAPGWRSWPPAPARLFQALVAGNARGRHLEPLVRERLEWLEVQGAPTVLFPLERWGQRVTLFPPSNEGDHPDVKGNPNLLRQKGSPKRQQARLFDPLIPLGYAWKIRKDDKENAAGVIELAHQLYQLGRGLDMAWSWGELLSEEEFEEVLRSYRGHVVEPGVEGGGNESLAVPVRGYLQFLVKKHEESRVVEISQRSRRSKRDARRVGYNQPPPDRAAAVRYAPWQQLRVYALYGSHGSSERKSVGVSEVLPLTLAVRDAALARLSEGHAGYSTEELGRALVGRKPDGTYPSGPTERVRIVPLPSIGHPQVDFRIRRVAVAIPASCPIRADDLDWAFSGAVIKMVGSEPVVLERCNQRESADVLKQYGAVGDCPEVCWQTVTPAALPVAPRNSGPLVAPRGGWRVRSVALASSVALALRHAGVHTRIAKLRIQPEPFTGRGTACADISAGERFPPGRLRNVCIEFDRPVSGPLVIGDGRFLGLGVMAPSCRVMGRQRRQSDEVPGGCVPDA